MEEKEKRAVVKLVIYGIAALVIIILVIAAFPFALISAGERGVVLRWGAVNRVLDEGLHWRTPIAEKVKKLEVRTQKFEADASSASKDLQTVHTKVALNFHLVPEQVGKLWAEIGEDYSDRVISPAIQESVKAATAKFTAEELITKRELVKDAIVAELKERLTPYHLLVETLNLTDFDFSPQFNQAIEAKVTAEQSALAAKNKLEQVKFEKEQRIAQAQGEAEAIRIQAEALRENSQLIQLEAVKRWDGELPKYMFGSAPLPFINIPQ